MKSVLIGSAAWFLIATGTAVAEPTPSAESAPESTPVSPQRSEPTVPVERLIAIVAKKTGKMFIIDPRVRGEVLLMGRAPSEVTYAELLGILRVYGFAAVEIAGDVRVVPDALVRSEAVPTISARDTRPADEVVTQVIAVKTLSAPQLVPILRSMVAQWGHMVAFPACNCLIVTDSFDNVRRIEGLIREMDAVAAGRPHDPGNGPSTGGSGDSAR